MTKLLNRAQLVQRYEEKEAVVNELKAKLDKAIEQAEFSLAALYCSDLQKALTSANAAANLLADFDGE